MAHWLKALVTKLEDLIQPRDPQSGREDCLPKVIFWPAHSCHEAHMPIQIHPQNK